MPITDTISVGGGSSPGGVDASPRQLRAAFAADDVLVSSVIPVAGGTQIVPEDGDRILIMFAMVGGPGSFTWGFTPAMAMGFGFAISTNDPVVLNRNEFGSLVCGAIWVVGAGLTLSVVTVARRRPLTTDRPLFPLIRRALAPVLAPVTQRKIDSQPFGQRKPSRWLGTWR